MRIAITGLAQSGRTTLWELLSAGHTGHRDNISSIKLPDARLEQIARVSRSGKTTALELELVDTRGDIAKGGTIFSELQGADGFIITIRGFDAGFGKPEPVSDAKKFMDAFILHDSAAIETRIKTLESDMKKGRTADERRQLELEIASLRKFSEILEQNGNLRMVDMPEHEQKIVRNQGLFVAIPRLAVVCTEETASQDILRQVSSVMNSPCIWLATKLEMELLELAPDEAALFRKEMAIPENAVMDTLTSLRNALQLVEFYTANEKEAHAWAIHCGATAVEAAAKIHTDIARGFIRAEVISCDKFIEAGGYAEARAKNYFRIEGKDYIIQDGDFIQFRFNV